MGRGLAVDVPCAVVLEANVGVVIEHHGELFVGSKRADVIVVQILTGERLPRAPPQELRASPHIEVQYARPGKRAKQTTQ
jgi:hypothetical protein